MLYSYAITPDVFRAGTINDTNRAGTIVVELLRGIADNGLIANLDAGRWLTQILRDQDGNRESPNLRTSINACLSLIHDRARLILHPAGSPRPDDDECRWLHWAIERHRSDPMNPFDGIFATEEYIEYSEIADGILVPLLQALDVPCWTNRRRSVRFEKTPENLQIYLPPLVRYADKVTLIDPYMTCRKDRFFDTVQYFAKLLGWHDGQRNPGVIEIHAGDPACDPDRDQRESVEDRLARWRDKLTPVAAHYGHKFRISLWKDRPGGKNFHDRYIITNQCGIDARGGLDFDDTPANWSGWSWLESGDAREILLNEFHPVKSPYIRLNRPFKVG